MFSNLWMKTQERTMKFSMNRVGQLIGKTAYVPGQGLLRVSNMWIYIIYTYIYIYIYICICAGTQTSHLQSSGLSFWIMHSDLSQRWQKSWLISLVAYGWRLWNHRTWPTQLDHGIGEIVSDLYIYIWLYGGFHKWGYPKNRWFDLGVSPF